jgi:hypothetical protein
VAEQLGTAVLDLEVNLAPLTKGLEQAKRLVQSASLELNVRTEKADTQFRRIEASVKTLQTQLRTLNATPLNLNTAALNKLGDEAVAAGRQINDFARSVINGNTALANNIVGLQQQGRAFSTLAANVKVGTAEFRNFTQAAAQANQKQLFAGFEEIKSLESLFRLGGSGGLSSFKGTEDLLAFSRQIGNTPAAINLYIRALEQARSVTKVTDTNFAKLTTEINRQIQALTQATAAAENYGRALGSRQLALPAGTGPGQFVLEGPSASDLAAEERRRRRAQKISERIDYFSTGGVSPQDPGLVPRPNAEAIAAEQRLSKARRDAARTAQSLAAAENKQAQQRKKASRDRLTGALSNALIGGAFPLLFGQGLGAAAGGAAGGGAGGLLGGQFGFGLSLVGTALGTAFDTALQKAQSLAQGLDNPIKNFDALKEASLLSSKALEKQVDILIASGRATEAEILLRRDLNALFGDPTGAQEYLNAVDELNRAWSQSTVLLASFVAGPLADLLTRLREALQTEVQLTKQERAGIARQAEQVVEGQTGPLQRTAFSSPVSINFRGQTLTGYANEIRETIARTLERDLVARKTSARAAEAAVKTETQLAAVRTAADQALKASGKAIVERALGFDRLAVATDLRQVRSQQNAIIPGFTGLNAQQQQEAASTLSVERLKEIDGLRIKEFQTLVKLQKLDKERAQRNIDLSRSIADTNALLNTQPGIYRDTLKQVQGFSTAILDAARAQDTGLSGLRLLREQLGKPTAANEGDRKRILSEQRTVTQEFVDAAGKVRLSLLEASESLRDNLRNAVLNFTKVRSDPAGLNQFLSPNRRRLRAEQDTAVLLPQFRAAQKTFFELTGERAKEFRGPREGVNEAIRNFIDIVQKEREVTLALQSAKTAQDLLKTNQDLLETNIQLALATAKLAEKQWKVDVNVVNQAGGASTVNAVTSLAS